ncbi:RhuM family protein [Arcobacter sp.]|uniref:RhuM family protein n=1 Tax=Arcobacter sp. TaxID=1872629 RepID=UPI003D0EE96D
MNEIVIYEDGNVELSTKVENDTLWLSQKQLCELFDRDKSVVSRHIKNIFKDEELEQNSVVVKNATTASDGKTYIVEYYNLDMIISLGYRINSKKATKFRQWATKVLKQYLIDGYVINKDRLQQQKLDELNQTLALIKNSIETKELNSDVSKGFVEIISNYAKSWALLQGYDEQTLQEVINIKEQKFILDYDESKKAIEEFKKALIGKGEATELFGKEKANEFEGNLLSIYQTFGGVELLPSIEQKASNLLYYVIKGHPFNDGNKRIGAYLFILFLSKNNSLYKSNGELKINDNALASLALLVATSKPEQKDIIIKLIMNILYEDDNK